MQSSLTPRLLHAFDLVIERAAPLRVGAIATGGERSHVAVIGGSLTGEGLTGRLVGGGETLLERGDGVTMVEANYYVALSDDVTVRCFGTGYCTDAHLRLTLLFEAAEDGPAAWLATRAFVGEQVAGTALLAIDRID